MSRPAGTTYVRWKVLGLTILVGFVAYLLRSNLSTAGVAMMQDLGLTDLQLGLVLGAFAWGYGLFQFPAGLFDEMVGGRRALTITACLWGALNLLVCLVPSPALASMAVIVGTLFVLRFLMGVAQAPLFPVIGGDVIAHWFPPSGWAVPNGLSNVGLTLGAAATPPLIGWLMQSLGWRASFAVTAPAAFIVAGAWWWYARNYPSEHQGVGQRELEIINAGRRSGIVGAEHLGAWKRILRNRDILLLTVSYFGSNYVFYFFFNWLFYYLIEVRHFAILEGGFLASVPWLVGCVGAITGGLVCDAVTRRLGIRWGCRFTSITGLLLAGGFLALAGAAQDPYLAVVYLSLCLGFQQFTDSAAWAATTSVGGEHSSAACGVLNTGGNVVGGLVAVLVPWTAHAIGWTAAIATGSLFAVLGAVVWIWIRADRTMVTT